MRDGIAYIRRDPLLSPLMTVAFCTGLFALGYLSLMPAYVGDVLHSNEPHIYGWLLASEGVGAFTGSVAATVLTNYTHRGRLLLSLVVAVGAGLIILGFVRSFAGAMVILFFIGALTSLMFTNNNVLLQTYATEEYRGRVFSVYFIGFSLAPLGSLLAGALTKVVSLQTTFIGLGVIVVFVAIIVNNRSPSLRKA